MDDVELQPFCLSALHDELPIVTRQLVGTLGRLISARGNYIRLQVGQYVVKLRCPAHLRHLFYRSPGVRASDRVEAMLREAFDDWRGNQAIVLGMEKCDGPAS